MIHVLHFVGWLVRLVGLALLVLGSLGSGWVGYNLRSFWFAKTRHGDSHWGVVAAIFYAAPMAALLLGGASLLLIGRLL